MWVKRITPYELFSLNVQSPPTSSVLSKTTTSNPLSRRHLAAARPDIPAPITTISVFSASTAVIASFAVHYEITGEFLRPAAAVGFASVFHSRGRCKAFRVVPISLYFGRVMFIDETSTTFVPKVAALPNTLIMLIWHYSNIMQAKRSVCEIYYIQNQVSCFFFKCSTKNGGRLRLT